MVKSRTPLKNIRYCIGSRTCKYGYCARPFTLLPVVRRQHRSAPSTSIFRWLAAKHRLGYRRAMPPTDEDADSRTYAVVANHEEQYSIWLADQALPNGWRAVGRTGSKAECLTYIGEVWTDMRPLSLQKRMDGQTV